MEERGFTLLSLRDGFERGGQGVDRLRTIHDVSGDELGLEDTRIAYHIRLVGSLT